MPFDLQSTQIAVAVVVGLLTITGTLFGWFGKVWRWASALFGPKLSVGGIDVPSKTMVLIPVTHPNALWWHMGSAGDRPLMQIVGRFNVTNISKHSIFVMAAKLRKPKAVGYAHVRAQKSNTFSDRHSIPPGGISELSFQFYVQPPVREAGKLFKADVAIVDQFANEHWLKGLEFPYN